MNIQTLIASGRLEEALSELVKIQPDAILLKGQYASAKRENGLGLLDGDDWRRTVARITHSALEMAGKTTVFVQNNTYITFLKEDQPGNELALFNKIFRALNQMVEDQSFPLAEIGEAVQAFNRHLPVSELVESFEDFQKSKYTKNTEAYRINAYREFVESLLENKQDFIEAVKHIVTEKQTVTGWKEAWELTAQEPTKDRWGNTRKLIDKRLFDAIFSDNQREKWAELSADVDSIKPGMLWKFNFSKILPDLKHWIGQNMR